MNVMALILIAAACVASAGRGIAVPERGLWNSQPEPVTLAPAEVSGSVDEAFERRLEAMDARVAAVRSLRASFTQKKHTPLLKNPMVSSGIIRIKDDVTRWDTVEPSPSVMTIDASGLSIYFPEQRVVEVYELTDDVREFSGSPLPRLASMRASFDLAPLDASELGGDRAAQSLVALELLPRTEALKDHIASVRVLIDESIPAVLRIEIEDVDGERTEIWFRDIKVNVAVDDREMKLDVPPGVRRVHPLSPGSDGAQDRDQ